MLAAYAIRCGQPLQSIPFSAVVVAGVDRRYSALSLSFIVSELWYGFWFLSAQSSDKDRTVVIWSPHEAESGPVFVCHYAVFFLVVLVVERAAGGGGAAVADEGSAETCGEERDAGVRTQCNGLRSVDVIAGDPEADRCGVCDAGAQRVWTAAQRSAIPAGRLFSGRAGGLLHGSDRSWGVARCNTDCGQRACGCES